MATPSSLSHLGKRQFVAMIAAIMAMGALGIDLMLPVFDELRAHFGLDAGSTDVAQIVTMYFLGMAVGQVFYGPFADRFGRKPVLYVGMAIYLLGAVGAAMAPSLSVMLAARFVWGIGAAGPRVVAVAVVRDVYEGKAMAKAMSFIMAVFIIIPILAPSIGAVIAALGPWQLVFWFCALYVIALAAWSTRLPETLMEDDRRPLRLGPVVDAARQVVSNRQAIGYTMAMAFLFGAFSSYLASSELIVGEIYGRPGLFPIIFGALATGMGAAMLTNTKLVERFGVRGTVRRAVSGYTILAVGLLLLTLLTAGTPPFLLALIGLSSVLVMHATMIPNLNTLAIEPMGHIAGTASAIIGTISLAGGALLGALIDRTMDTTITPLVIGFVVYGTIAAGWITWAEAGRAPARAGTPAPVAGGGD